MSENINKKKIAASVQKKAFLKRKNVKKRFQALGFTGVSLAKLEDSKNLNVLGQIAAVGTSFAHKKALEISDEVIYADEGQIIRQVKGRKPQIIEHISPRKVTKGEVLIINRCRV
ncbi:MAG: hypothetical protein ACPGUH_05635 [Winogradskyella sp.]